MNTQQEGGEGRAIPSNRRHRGALLWLGLVAVLLLALPLLAPKSAPRASYTRYVSPPLPDGTRFTFLYPADLKRNRYRLTQSGFSQEIDFSTPDFASTPANVVSNAVPLLRDTRRDESVLAMVRPFERGDGRVKQTEHLDLERNQDKVLNLPHDVYYHCLWFYDARAGEVLHFIQGRGAFGRLRRS
ncbi:MAG: hypothetical protein M3Y13_10795 [Armatimonadota bacterium]|nr:hypothetical protein [Armatimonadota bacterium]